MNKVSSIVFIDDNKTIKSGFRLDSLKNINVITGQNNSGKTNFVLGIIDKKAKFLDESEGEIKNIKIVYIAAENIEPDENECKTSAESSKLFENLSNLFLDLGISFTIKEQDKVQEVVDSLFIKLNKNLESFNFGQKIARTPKVGP